MVVRTRFGKLQTCVSQNLLGYEGKGTRKDGTNGAKLQRFHPSDRLLAFLEAI